jgi:hypothetical protein
MLRSHAMSSRADQRGAAGAVAGASVLFFMTLGAVLVVLGWIGLSVYAIVKAIGGGDHPSPTTVILFFVLLVTTLVTLFTGSIALIGRSLTPRKAKKGREEQLTFDLATDEDVPGRA